MNCLRPWVISWSLRPPTKPWTRPQPVCPKKPSEPGFRPTLLQSVRLKKVLKSTRCLGQNSTLMLSYEFFRFSQRTHCRMFNFRRARRRSMERQLRAMLDHFPTASSSNSKETRPPCIPAFTTSSKTTLNSNTYLPSKTLRPLLGSFNKTTIHSLCLSQPKSKFL